MTQEDAGGESSSAKRKTGCRFREMREMGRFQAAAWLEMMAGPLGLPAQPTEQEFVSCLKSGLVLCNAINKIQSGAVPKVITNQSAGLSWENQTLTAYQYFENIRNFLVAVDELKIPSFEISDIERETMEAGSVGNIVDCILGLKAYHEWKQSSKSNGPWKYSKSPMVSRTRARIQSNVPALVSSARCLDMSPTSEKLQPMKLEDQMTKNKVDFLVRAVADSMFSAKENIDQGIFDSWKEGTADPIKLFNRIISSCLQNKQLKAIEESLVEENEITDVSNSNSICKCCNFSSGEASCNHRKLLEAQEIEIEEIKALLSKTKLECAALQSQVQNDFRQIEEVYKETQSLIRSVMDGYNVCIFAYGQTGSGKTYSMCGPVIGSAKDIGINSMALNDLFQISCTREDIKYDIHVQMVEIYNEQFVSLTNFTLEIRNCLSNGGLSLPDATMHHVVSTSDVVNLMKIGERNRAFSCTAMNNRSSRSHSVVTIHVCGRDVLGHKLQSCLHLVDLAGSERVDKSEVTGDRMKEAQHINKSLSCLGDVISALAQKSSHIPYRNSKLTLLLQNSLGGHSKMLMLAHVSPEAESYGETISTLKFAQRVSTVELGVAHVNKESVEISDLREQIDSLKKELASKEHSKATYLHKMKENTPLIERENYPDDRKQPFKTPLPRPKCGTEQSATRSRRLSLEGYEKNQQKAKNTESDHLQIAAEQVKQVAHEEIERLPACSPAISCSSSVSQLTVGSTCGQLGGFATPDTNKTKLKSSSTFSSSRGSQHIRKSLQTIGKLINGSEKRNYQVSSLMPPTKFNTDFHAAKKSPATVESRIHSCAASRRVVKVGARSPYLLDKMRLDAAQLWILGRGPCEQPSGPGEKGWGVWSAGPDGPGWGWLWILGDIDSPASSPVPAAPVTGERVLWNHAGGEEEASNMHGGPKNSSARSRIGKEHEDVVLNIINSMIFALKRRAIASMTVRDSFVLADLHSSCLIRVDH
ncbi:Kinesin-4 [Platanthera guangdongensis]|uniref:Kinesin-4 n=1 Tax=Platanthera guangdongensis TaxID=2320717 RepID=A0ABR2MGX4_9ASPA